VLQAMVGETRVVRVLLTNPERLASYEFTASAESLGQGFNVSSAGNQEDTEDHGENCQ
jgi:hypothetical protein